MLAGRDGLRVNDPVLIPDLGRDLMIKLGVFHQVTEFGLEDFRQGFDRQKEVDSGAMPVAVGFGKSPTGNDIVDVWMIWHLSSPGVQNAEEARHISADVFWICGQLFYAFFKIQLFQYPAQSSLNRAFIHWSGSQGSFLTTVTQTREDPNWIAVNLPVVSQDVQSRFGQRYVAIFGAFAKNHFMEIIGSFLLVLAPILWVYFMLHGPLSGIFYGSKITSIFSDAFLSILEILILVMYFRFYCLIKLEKHNKANSADAKSRAAD